MDQGTLLHGPFARPVDDSHCDDVWMDGGVSVRTFLTGLHVSVTSCIREVGSMQIFVFVAFAVAGICTVGSSPVLPNQRLDATFEDQVKSYETFGFVR